MPAWMPIIAGASAAFNAFSTQARNRKDRDWKEYMYERQRQDSIAQWNMQNEYNSPKNQMQRLKDAGINPQFGFTGAGAGATGNAGSIDTPSPMGANPQAVQLDAGSMIGSFIDTEVKQAQISVANADAAVKYEQAALMSSQRDRNVYDLDFEKELRGWSAEARKETVRKMKADTKYKLAENERRAIENEASVGKALAEILRIRVGTVKDAADIKRINQMAAGLEKDNTIKDLDIELRKKGINPNHPMWAQILGRLAQNIMNDPAMKYSKGGKILQKLFGF